MADVDDVACVQDNQVASQLNPSALLYPVPHFHQGVPPPGQVHPLMGTRARAPPQGGQSRSKKKKEKDGCRVDAVEAKKMAAVSITSVKGNGDGGWGMEDGRLPGGGVEMSSFGAIGMDFS